MAKLRKQILPIIEYQLGECGLFLVILTSVLCFGCKTNNGSTNNIDYSEIQLQLSRTAIELCEMNYKFEYSQDPENEKFLTDQNELYLILVNIIQSSESYIKYNEGSTKSANELIVRYNQSLTNFRQSNPKLKIGLKPLPLLSDFMDIHEIKEIYQISVFHALIARQSSNFISGEFASSELEGGDVAR
jgi:hypothetical protein